MARDEGGHNLRGVPAGDRTDRSAPLLEAEGLRVTAAQRKAWQAAGAARPLIGDAISID